MEAYRDQYATLFNNGRKVIVLGISVDADTMQANWARESDFPMVFGSDPNGAVGKLYAAYDSTRKMDNRSLYVIDPQGRIAYKTPNFRVLAQEAYTDLAAIVDKLSPPKAETPQ
jgi:peroxiredoxin